MKSALIHRARFITRAKGARDEQGERPVAAPVAGPWIAARLMERGAVAAKSRRRPSSSTDARVPRGYELLLDFEDEAGVLVEKPTAGAEVETDCPILASPNIELDGEPEVLNDGEELIGYLCYATKPKDRR